MVAGESGEKFVLAGAEVGHAVQMEKRKGSEQKSDDIAGCLWYAV